MWHAFPIPTARKTGARQTRSPYITRRTRRQSRWSKASRPCRARLSIGSLVIGLGLEANGLGFPATTSNDPTKLRPGSPVIGSRAAMGISGLMDAGDSCQALRGEDLSRDTPVFLSNTGGALDPSQVHRIVAAAAKAPRSRATSQPIGCAMLMQVMLSITERRDAAAGPAQVARQCVSRQNKGILSLKKGVRK